MPIVHYESLAEVPSHRYEHAHATNVIYDAFGPAQGMPMVSVVDRPPQRGFPSSLHKHLGYSELIVMLEGDVVLWCGASPAEVRPYRLRPSSMFLIPADHCHVFVNGERAARWLIVFVPGPGARPASTREEVSLHHTARGIPIPADVRAEIERSAPPRPSDVP